MEVELAPPDSAGRVHIRGRVTWAHPHAGRIDGRERVAVGLCFLDLAGAAREAVSHYVAAYRPHVVAAMASPREERICRAAIAENEFHLHFAASEAELREVLARGDISVVVVFGDSEQQAAAAVDVVTEGRPSRRSLRDVIPEDPTPRVVFCGTAASDRLLQMHNQGKVHQSLGRQVDVTGLALEVHEASEDYAVRRELQRVTLELERAHLRDLWRQRGVPRADGGVGGLVVASAPMQGVIALVRTVAGHNIHVLLQGETGTGKELLARAIHDLSARAGAPFVAQDCGALTETLLDSELFGHVKGAFTGAVTDHPGLFQVAEGGTIFLDEIQNMTPVLQAKLLRAIDTGEVRPVGSARTRRVDVRVVAASNRDLRGEVDGGRFRADLFYRLSRFPIEVPPLRARPGDVLPLAREFLRQVAESLSREMPALDSEVDALLVAYEWPGNVRELRNVIERAVLLSHQGRVTRSALPPYLVKQAEERSSRQTGGRASLRDRVREYERELIRGALERHGGVLRHAARELVANPVTLGRRARAYRLVPGDE